ncbi:UspA domain protein [Acidothermus cellulolyticus 11B]|uniref:UspA domain protein n=1 Tax=Acidothermus cellulolyticus (strain ATCC 43068 / DSM 8971 / 11B) TaxID=351607 RepID=A0LVT6_ACIC1|nr:universal stress protein [Acidothermus cellulolyticus]ABK53546.1 UspA domain protein [Acidothermus cellulolyticus 11B]MCL6550186.1 universal stress protein [Acidothermus cellulolyticus]
MVEQLIATGVDDTAHDVTQTEPEPTATEARRNLVVVGVDGSACSAKALAWAEEYAKTVGADLALVIAWHWPTAYGEPIPFEDFTPEADAAEVLRKAAATLTLPSERVRLVVRQGAAGDVLVKASESARLLVVGCRGHGSLLKRVIGSTSIYCAHHAHCPVVIVR